MKTEQQRYNKRKVPEKYRIIVFTIPLILTAICFSIATVKSEELTKFRSEAPTINNLSLIYNSIDASGFPRIVSLVNVLDEADLIVTKLDTNNFEVHEDNVRGRPIEVIELLTPEEPPNVVLTIDAISSMIDKPLQDAKNAAIAFVNLMQGDDKSAVVHFNRQTSTDHDFSNNKNLLISVIQNIKSVEGTAIYDALLHSADLLRGIIKNRVIILLTDRADQNSCHTYRDALKAVIPLEIRIFTIGLNINAGNSEGNVLKNLASETGGLYFRSPSSNDLELIYQAISGILHHSYQISYSTHNPAKDGTLQHVRIDVAVNTSTSWDNASYRAPYEETNDDTVTPPNPIPSDSAFEGVPNPFTPNNDRLNDWVEFKKRDTFPQEWNITIMDRSGTLIRHLIDGGNIWDGNDKSGNIMLPESYLHFFANGKHVIHRDLIQLVR